MAFDTSTDSPSYTGGYGYAPYQEAAQKAQYRLSLQDRLLAALSGLGSVRPGAGFGESFLQAAGGSARATWAAKQAAMNYAQRQAEQEQARQDAEIRNKYLEAQTAVMSRPPQEPKIPTKQQDYERLVNELKMDPTEARQIVYGVTPKEQAALKPPAEAKTPTLVQVQQPDGSIVYMPTSQAVGKKPPPPASDNKPATAGERRSSGALSRAEGLDRDATSLEKNLTPVDMLRLKTPYAIQTLREKRYTNARKAFTETVLREFSGAAISKDEYSKYDQIFFAQPGDDKKTLEQKRQARAGILAQLKSMSGSAAKDMGLSGLDSLLGGGSSVFDPNAARAKYGY